jgi:amino acid adenylation domain-containing protein
MTVIEHMPKTATANTGASANASSTPRNVEDIYPLTPLQEGMLFHVLSAPESSAYFEQYTCLLRGPLDADAFTQAWQLVVDRHSALRTLFMWEKRDKPVQVVRASVELPCANFDWSAQTAQEQQAHLQRWLREDRQRGFDLTRAPLMRITLIRLGADSHQLVWSFHHMLLDGWSGPILFSEVFALYEALCQGRPIQLPTPQPYKTYVLWQQAQSVAEAEAFWRERLRGFDTPTPLPLPKPPASANQDIEDRYPALQLRFDPAFTAMLRTFARKERVTLNTLLQAAWALVLNAYSGEDDVLFGATLSGRSGDLPGVENMVGLFINTLPARVKIEPDRPVGDWLRALQAQQAAVSQYEYSALVDVHGWSEVPRDQPLFNSIFVFENYPVDAAAGEAGSSIKVSDVRAYEITNYPLTIAVLPASQMVLQVTYDREQFAAADIERMLGHIHTALQHLMQDAKRPLSAVTIVSEQERQQVLVTWNDTDRDYARDASIQGLFEQRAALHPERVAYCCDGATLTYGELDRKANQLAHYLRALGVRRDSVVGVSVERSFEMVIALLAIFKAGGAYVPMDPNYPKERLSFILNDARVPILLTQQRLLDKLPVTDAHVVRLDADWAQISQLSAEPSNGGATADDVAYVLYTSGSTGMPKGVMGLHRGAINRFSWMWSAYPFAPNEVCCQKTSLNFGDSIWEIFGPLLQGVPVVIVPEDGVKDARELVKTMGQHGVTRLVLVPSLLRAILDTHDNLNALLPSLRICVASGEALPIELVRRFHAAMPHCTLLNLYGSSEVSADITYYDTTHTPDHLANMPIGRPMANARVYLLDQHMRPVPIGIPGELYAGGDGLARGYYRRPDLTAEKFVPNPFDASGKSLLFRTGDLARYLPDGDIEYLGRTDFQVKIRGFRIELAEVEMALASHSKVHQAVAAAHIDQNGDRRLTAYIVPHQGQTISATEIRQHMLDRLPDYMAPSSVITLDALPLTPSGKINRRALPEPGHSDLTAHDAVAPPTTALEAKLVLLWEEMLGVRGIGIRHNFFELGGHSLLAVRMFARIEKDFGIRLEVARLFGAPTIEKLAKVIDADSGYTDWYSLVALQLQGPNPPLFMAHSLGGCVGDFEAWVPHLGLDQPFFGLRSMGYGSQPPFTTIPDMAAHYLRQIRSIAPHGPYCLSGYDSMGGAVAFEMARQLEAEGCRDNLLLIINAEAPHMNYRKFSAQALPGFVQNLPHWLSDFAHQPKDAALRQIKRMPILDETVQTVPYEVNPAFYDLRGKIVTTNYQALMAYQPQPIEGEITLFRMRRQPLLCSFEPTMGWTKLSARPVQIKVISGTLTTIISDPDRARKFARAMRACIEEFKARQSS